jgi:integrase
MVSLRRVEPGRPPQLVQLDLVFRTERGTPVNPNHASRAFARLAASVGLAAHPHLLRHALASAMAANKEPASIIAASSATPTAARSPSGSTSTSSPKPSPGWLG